MMALGKAWAWTKRHWRTVALVAAVVLFGVAFFVAGKSCTACEPDPVPVGPVVVGGIDSGPGEERIARALDAAAQQAAADLERIEREQREAIERFNAKQRAEYEAVKRRGPTAVADWLTQFNRRLRDGGR